MIAPRSISLLQPATPPHTETLTHTCPTPFFTIMAHTIPPPPPNCLSFLCVCIPSHSQPRSTGQRFGSARDMLAKRKVMVFTTAAPRCWQPALPKWHTLFGFPTFIELHGTLSLSWSPPHTHTFNQPWSCISCQCATKPSHLQTEPHNITTDRSENYPFCCCIYSFFSNYFFFSFWKLSGLGMRGGGSGERKLPTYVIGPRGSAHPSIASLIKHGF